MSKDQLQTIIRYAAALKQVDVPEECSLDALKSITSTFTKEEIQQYNHKILSFIGEEVIKTASKCQHQFLYEDEKVGKVKSVIGTN